MFPGCGKFFCVSKRDNVSLFLYSPLRETIFASFIKDFNSLL